MSLSQTPSYPLFMNSGPKQLILGDARGDCYSVPADIRSITTFSLLEQGRWFEKEVGFVDRLLAPGMVALDIGANLGMYTLPLARRVGATGQVYAYEPSEASRAHLARTLALNSVDNVTIRPLALAGRCGNGHLTADPSAELNAIAEGTDGAGESVAIRTLDAEMNDCGWPRVDFVKLDAEGMEEAILHGAQDFFTRFAPIVMYERIHRGRRNQSLGSKFRMLGYRIFRLLGDGAFLVELEPDETPDVMELNLFAIPPALVPMLVAQGLIAESGAVPSLTTEERRQALDAYCGLPFARQLEIDPEDVENCPLADALIGYSAYRFLPGIEPARRYALLLDACRRLQGICAANPTPAALASLARVAGDFGWRIVARDALTQMIALRDEAVDSPFFPPSPRFEAAPAEDFASWLGQDIRETLEFARNHSSISGANLQEIETLAESELASVELLKRLALVRLLSGAGENAIAPALARLTAAEGRRGSDWAANVCALARGKP